MVRLFEIVILFSFASALAAEPDPVAKWLDELGSEAFETREAAESALKAYVSANHLKAMEIGHRLYEQWVKADADVRKRLGNVLDPLAEVGTVGFPDDADLCPDMHGESTKLGEIPLLLGVVTSYQMLKFYRATVQTNRHPWHDPKLDFKEEWLAFVHLTHGGHVKRRPLKRGESLGPDLKEMSCKRDFRARLRGCRGFR